jgi:hypothetical protein
MPDRAPADTIIGGSGMLMAQGLAEYGALSGGGSSAISNFLDTVDYAVRDAGPTTWVAAVFGVIVLWFVCFRR